jgi:hypothetical protein
VGLNKEVSNSKGVSVITLAEDKTFQRFKKELQELISASKISFNQKHYFFDNADYPDIDAILMIPLFLVGEHAERAEILLEKVYEKLNKGKISVYLSMVHEYRITRNEELYKSIGEILVPVVEQAMEEINVDEKKADWIRKFETDYQLKFFGNPLSKTAKEKKIVYFENLKQTKWYVMIDQNRRLISVKKLTHDNFYDRRIKEQSIVDCLLEKVGCWQEIGLESVENIQYEVEKVIDRDYHYEFYYNTRETLNAFGNKDWSEF